MANLTLKQLRYFESLARHGHFGRAAEAAAISQPALSMQIKELEDGLGAPLFDRSARAIRLTGFGDALIRIDGKRLEPLVYEKELGGFKEFIVPRDVVGDGKITVTFDRPEESHLAWRNYSRISDIWLIKR